MKKSSVYISVIMVVLLAFAAVLTAGCKAAFPEGQQAAPGPAEATSEPTEPVAEVTPEPTLEPAPYEATAFFLESRLSPTVIGTVDESKVGTEKTIEIGGKELTIVYSQSVHFDNGNNDYDEYNIVGYSDNSKVRLGPDGQINRLYIYSTDPQLFKLDITLSDSEEKIRESVERIFENDVDFSRYNSFRVDDTNRIISWSHRVNGISSRESFGITMYDDCSIASLSIGKPHFNWDNLPEDFKLDLFMPLIEQTMKEEYGDAYISSHMIGYWLTDTEGQPSIYCEMGVNYRDSKGEATSEARELIIQFHLDDIMIG